MLRKCRMCGIEARSKCDLNNFVRNKASRHGRQNLCLRCNVRQHSDWKDANHDRVKRYYRKYNRDNAPRRQAYNKKYKLANRDKCYAQKDERRARIKELPSTTVSRLAIWERDGGCCHMCLRYLQAHEFHLDHLIPLSLDYDDHPGHVPENLAVACPSCNFAKRDRWADWELVKHLRKHK